MADILIVEDNRELRELLRDFLKSEGYSVHASASAEEAEAFLKKEEVRLVILDIMLPGADGFTVLNRIRRDGNTPVLVVSARTEKEDKLNGLTLGADDYIEKPYDIDIMLAKIDGIFKRRYEQEMISDGRLKLNKGQRTAWMDEKELSLTAKEFDLLLLFVTNKGKTLRKDWLFQNIWGMESFSEQQTLTVHVKWLREKIEADPKNPRHIITVWGVGYRYE